MKNIIKEAIHLRKLGKLEESNILLLNEQKKAPNDAYLNYQVAWSYDVLGQEEQAIPFYEKSIELGLDKIYLEEAYLGLGSTYRVTGDYQKSFELLRIAIQEFPQNNALLTFYSMTLYNLGKGEESMEILLKLLATTSADNNIQDFSKAILFYSDKLNQTWL